MKKSWCSPWVNKDGAIARRRDFVNFDVWYSVKMLASFAPAADSAAGAGRAIRKRGDIAELREEIIMPCVKSEFELNPNLLTVPVGFHEPRLRAAGLAWLSMAVELFNDEVYSQLELTWFRPTDTVPKLVISLDSSKNFRTKAMLDCPGAPLLIYNRRARLDAALQKLMERTTPEDLWAALANQRLANIGAWEFLQAWTQVVGPEAAKTSYPRLSSAEEFLFQLMSSMKKDTHPWL